MSMGFLRFFLAYLVLLSHTGVRINGLNEGVFAVVIFYILAGHVVTKLFFDIFQKDILSFYIDRFLRIYPLYIFIVFITLFFLILTGFGNPNLNLVNIIFNELIIPLNYYMIIGDYIVVLKDSVTRWWLIPPAWSLGAEVQVYLLMPFLLMNRYLFFAGFFISLIVYSIANVGILHSDYFGYRLVAGVLFIFLLGSLIEKYVKNKADKWEKFVLFSSYMFLLFWFLIFVMYFGKYGAYTRETLLGILIGVPAVIFIRRYDRKNKINKFFGDLSYGIFLSHFLGIWVWEYITGKQEGEFFIPFVGIFAFLIAFLGVLLIDRPISRLRIKKS